METGYIDSLFTTYNTCILHKLHSDIYCVLWQFKLQDRNHKNVLTAG